MKGYVARKRDRYYAVIYEGLDPVTGRPHRSWHPAGTNRDEAEQLARKLAAERNGRDDEVRSLTFGAYLMTQWLPGKKLTLATSTYRGYLRKPSSTSSRPWAGSGSGVFGHTTSRRSMATCSSQATAAEHEHPRLSTTCTSSSEEHSTTLSTEAS